LVVASPAGVFGVIAVRAFGSQHRFWRAGLPALIATLAACLAVTVESSLAAGTGACDAHRSAAALVTARVVVYGLPTREPLGTPHTTTYYACLRPSGRSLELGTDELGALYGSDATTGGFAAAGTYAAAQSSAGVADLAICARYHSSTRLCSAAHYWLSVADTATGRRARLPIYARLAVPALVPFPVTLALSPDGALAWLQNAVVGETATGMLQLWATALAPRSRFALEAAPSMIDSGSIARASVRFQGRVLEWTRDGAPHSKTLG
jgi:hypothetical protein